MLTFSVLTTTLLLYVVTLMLIGYGICLVVHTTVCKFIGTLSSVIGKKASRAPVRIVCRDSTVIAGIVHRSKCDGIDTYVIEIPNHRSFRTAKPDGSFATPDKRYTSWHYPK